MKTPTPHDSGKRATGEAARRMAPAVRGLVGRDLGRGGGVRRAVALQLRMLRRGRGESSRQRLATLRAAWAMPRAVRLAATLPLLWQAHIVLYCRMLERHGIRAPKRYLAELLDSWPETVSRWLRPDDPVRPDFRSRAELRALMPDLEFPPSWRTRR